MIFSQTRLLTCFIYIVEFAFPCVLPMRSFLTPPFFARTAKAGQSYSSLFRSRFGCRVLSSHSLPFAHQGLFAFCRYHQKSSFVISRLFIAVSLLDCGCYHHQPKVVIIPVLCQYRPYPTISSTAHCCLSLFIVVCPFWSSSRLSSVSLIAHFGLFLIFVIDPDERPVLFFSLIVLRNLVPFMVVRKG